MALALALACAPAWMPVRAVALSAGARTSSLHARLSDERVDSLVLYGDAGVLVGYGSVQSAVDQLLMPLAVSQPELFTQNQPVLGAQWQGVTLAICWVLITLSINGYRPSATRTLPSREALIPLAVAWLGSSALLLLIFFLVGLPLEAELEFALGSATVVGGWRWLYSNRLPLV